jgi:predicted  nucleic acid-binding Zn-ribbon protein
MNGSEEISEEILIETFGKRYPHLKDRLLALSAHFAGRGGYGVFAPIRINSCGVCAARIAMEDVQKALSGSFITCASCARFLYVPGKLLI